MESESKNEVEEGLKTPEVDQESKAVEANYQSTNGYDPEPSHDSHDKQKCKSASSVSQLDDTLRKNATALKEETPRNIESSSRFNPPLAEEPRGFMDPPELTNMSYSEKITLMFFRQAGVPEDEAIAKINQFRQERGIPVFSEQNGGTESTEERSKDTVFKGSQKVMEIDDESVEVTDACSASNASAGGSAPSSSDDESDEESSDPNTSVDKEILTSNEDVVASQSKVVRHPDCKYTKEELKKMAQQIQTKKSREQFVYKTYVCGHDKDEQLKIFLDEEANKPRLELRKMSKLLPKKLRSEFYRTSMRRKNPHTLMRKYLSMPQNQQWLLCNRLKLKNTKLLSKLFQRPGQKSNSQACRPLKEWFNIFLQEGSVDEAISKVKKLILQGAVAGENARGKIAPKGVAPANQSVDGAVAGENAQGAVAGENAGEEVAPKDVAPANQSLDGAESDEEVTSCRQLGKKSMARRNKKFRQLSEGQLKVYNSWLEQGLCHQDALSIVLRFPGDHRSTRMNACAWGNCDKHPKSKFPKPPRTESGANGTSPSVGSKPDHFKKTIFDRIPVPSIVVDTSSPIVAGLPSEHQTCIPITGINNGISIVPQVSSGIPPVTAVAGLPLQGQTSIPTGIKNGTSITPSSRGSFPQSEIPLSATRAPTLAMGGQGPRVPQKSTFVDKSNPVKPAGSIEQDPSSADTLNLCIVPLGYPKECFSDEEFEAIENSMYVAISAISDDRMKPIFKKRCRNNGKYEIICHDQLSKKWLHKYVATMYPVVPLKIIPAEPTKIEASQADKRASTSDSAVRSLDKKQLPNPENKHENQEPFKNSGSVSKMRGDPSRKDLPKTVGQNSQEPHEPRYGGRRHSHEYVDTGEQYGVMTKPRYNANMNDPGIGPQDYGWSPRFAYPPGMPPRFANPPGMPPRFAHPPGMPPPRFAHPPGMPPRFAHPPGMPPRFAYPPGMPPRFGHPPGMHPRFAHPPGIPPMYAHPLGAPPMYVQSGQPPSDGFFLEKPKHMEQATERNEPRRSPSPEFAELLKSVRSRLNLPDEPTDTAKSSSSENRKPVHEKNPARSPPSTKRRAEHSSNRNDPPRRMPVSGGSMKRNHSPQGSSPTERNHSPQGSYSRAERNHSPQGSFSRAERNHSHQGSSRTERNHSAQGSYSRAESNHSPQGCYSRAERNHSPQSSYSRAERNHSPQGSYSRSERNHSPQGSYSRSERNHSPQGSYSRAERNHSPQGSYSRAERNHSPRGSYSRAERNHSSQGSYSRAERNHSPQSSYSRAERNRSPQGSLSRPGPRKRSRSSPLPVRSTKSSRRN